MTFLVICFLSRASTRRAGERVTFLYSGHPAFAPALLYLRHPCRRPPSTFTRSAPVFAPLLRPSGRVKKSHQKKARMSAPQVLRPENLRRRVPSRSTRLRCGTRDPASSLDYKSDVTSDEVREAGLLTATLPRRTRTWDLRILYDYLRANPRALRHVLSFLVTSLLAQARKEVTRSSAGGVEALAQKSKCAKPTSDCYSRHRQ